MCLLLYFERVPEVMFFCCEGINISCLYSVLGDLPLMIFLFQQNEKSQLNWLGTGFVRFVGLLYVVLLEGPLQKLVPSNASTASSLFAMVYFLYNQFKELELLDINNQAWSKSLFYSLSLIYNYNNPSNESIIT